MLIIEEQLIVGMDLQKQLRKNGFNVIVGKTVNDIVRAAGKDASNVIITSPDVLKGDKLSELADLFSILNGKSEKAFLNPLSDTIILDNDPETFIRFSKPYKASDIVKYVAQCSQKRIQE